MLWSALIMWSAHVDAQSGNIYLTYRLPIDYTIDSKNHCRSQNVWSLVTYLCTSLLLSAPPYWPATTQSVIFVFICSGHRGRQLWLSVSIKLQKMMYMYIKKCIGCINVLL